MFISWSHEPDPQSEAARTHRARVLALADQLRAGGVDAQLDLYEPNPLEGWPTWMSNGIENAEFILVVCTATYLRRWKGEGVDPLGLVCRAVDNIDPPAGSITGRQEALARIESETERSRCACAECERRRRGAGRSPPRSSCGPARGCLPRCLTAPSRGKVR